VQGKPRSSRRKNLPQLHFCPSQNPTWPDPGLNPGRRGGKLATNRLSYGAAVSQSLYLLRYPGSRSICISNFSAVAVTIHSFRRLLLHVHQKVIAVTCLIEVSMAGMQFSFTVLQNERRLFQQLPHGASANQGMPLTGRGALWKLPVQEHWLGSFQTYVCDFNRRSTENAWGLDRVSDSDLSTNLWTNRRSFSPTHFYYAGPILCFVTKRMNIGQLTFLFGLTPLYYIS
jgi:hypothetical protein